MLVLCEASAHQMAVLGTTTERINKNTNTDRQIRCINECQSNKEYLLVQQLIQP